MQLLDQHERFDEHGTRLQGIGRGADLVERDEQVQLRLHVVGALGDLTRPFKTFPIGDERASPIAHLQLDIADLQQAYDDVARRFRPGRVMRVLDNQRPREFKAVLINSERGLPIALRDQDVADLVEVDRGLALPSRAVLDARGKLAVKFDRFAVGRQRSGWVLFGLQRCPDF